MYIGYNIEKINNVMNGIRKAYLNANSYIVEEFPHLKSVFRTHWIGYDEYDFETNLVGRLNMLIGKGFELCETTLKTLRELALAWIRFQQNNVIEDKGVATKNDYVNSAGEAVKNRGWHVENINNMIESLEGPLFNTSQMESVSSGEQPAFSASTNFGLLESGSPSAITAAMDNFVTNVKNNFKSLFEAIETDKAFYGVQANSLKEMMEELAGLLGELTTALRDLENAMNKLTNDSYTSSDAAVVEELSKTKGVISEKAEEIGESRWTV